MSARDLEGARGRIRILKRAGVGRDRGEKILRDLVVERQVLALEQLEENLTGGGRDRVDVDEVAVARIARMMIDVDPELRLRDGSQAIVTEPLPGRGVEREHDIEILVVR